jgi:hypothetical protein
MAAPGWLRLWRAIEDNKLFRKKPFDPLHAWIDLLIKASWKESECWHNERCIKINPGQILTSTYALSTDWGWNRSKVRRFLNTLKTDLMIDLQPDPHCTVITICKWETYQNPQEASDLPSGLLPDPPATYSRPTPGLRATPLEEVKKLRSEEEERTSSYEDVVSLAPGEQGSAEEEKQDKRNPEMLAKAQEILEYAKVKVENRFGKKFQKRGDLQRRDKVFTRMNTDRFSEAELKQAVDNFVLDDWDGRVNHCDPANYVFGSKAKVVKWLEYEPKGAGTVPGLINTSELLAADDPWE